MKIDIEKRPVFYQLDQDLDVRPKALLNYMQEAVFAHSSWAGCGAKDLMAQNRAWILHRIAIEIIAPLKLGDSLTVTTWHKGEKGLRAYRDFEVTANGKTLVTATSLWLFINLEKRKILRIPEDAGSQYTVEPDTALDLDIDAWRPNLRLVPNHTETIEIRPSDFDPLNHVNNALYFEFLDILVERIFKGKRKICRVIMQFNKEITMGVDRIEIGMDEKEDHFAYTLFSPGSVHAAGELWLTD